MPIRPTLAAGVIAAILAPTIGAHATLIKLNGVTQISDTYEGDTVGANPVADTGAWVTAQTANRDLGIVTNAVSPGAYEGTQYFEGDTNGVNNEGHFGEVTIVNGDLLHWESMVFLPAANASQDYPWQFMIVPASNTTDASLRLLNFYRYSSGQFVEATPSETNFSTPAGFAHGVWQKWAVDLTVGASSASFAINNGTPASIPMTNSVASAAAYRIGMTANGAGVFFLDTAIVPEPAALALLSLGSLALLRRRNA